MKITLYIFLACSSLLQLNLSAKKNILYIGTGGKDAKGIYRTHFDQESGKFSEVTLAAEANSPGFLAHHPKKNILFTVARWAKEAGVIGYQIGKDGSLNEFTRQSCPDGMACHLTVHPSGHFLITTQYGGGSVALFPLDITGQLSKPLVYEHSGGSKVFGNRQDSPHPHWCGFSPCGNFLLVPDLGLDQIVIYLVNKEAENLSHHGFAQSRKGGGPRHMKFSVDGRFIYLLNELSLTVETFKWDAETGKATSLFETATLTENEKAEETFNSAAEILVHPSGNWIYCSNRGHDSVTVFRGSKDGSLKVIQKQPIRGAFPRNINLTTDGEWLLAAGQESNTISAHRIDPKNGKLIYQRGGITNIPNPICLLFGKNSGS